MKTFFDLFRRLIMLVLAVRMAAEPSIEISTGSLASPVRLSLSVEDRLATRAPQAPDLATAYWVVTPLPVVVRSGSAYYGAVRSINAHGDVLGSDLSVVKHVDADGTVSELGSYNFHFNGGRQLDDAGRVVLNTKFGNEGLLFTVAGGVPSEAIRYPGTRLTSLDNAGGLLGVTLSQTVQSDQDYWGLHFVEREDRRRELELPADSNFGADLMALNERDEVVGGALQIPRDWWRGLYLKPGRDPRWLPGFGQYEEVYNLNIHGQLVGSTAVPAGFGYAPGVYPALWDSGGVGRVKVLDTDRSLFGGEYGWAWAANRWGHIVGRTRSGGALWLNGQPHDLVGRIINPDNIRLDYFADINDKGEIVGAEYGFLTSPRTFIMRPVWPSLAVDLNRDGKIALPLDGDKSDVTTPAMPFRFWINDDDDDGDEMNQTLLGGNSDEPGRLSGFWEMDGRAPDYENQNIDGRCDLADLFPIVLDIKSLVTLVPPSESVKYKLKQADSAINIVYTDLSVEEATEFLYHNSERATYGPGAIYLPGRAPTHQVTAEGLLIEYEYLERIVAEGRKGVVLVEGRKASSRPLNLSVEKNGIQIANLELNICIDEIGAMYRWVNLRSELGQAEISPTNTEEPSNYPDTITNGKMFIFVHGYNVDERQSRAWMAEVFKRLWQSGSRAMFTAVSWHGDYSQVLNTVSPDYWDNIARAFKTAPELAREVTGLPGASKVIAGHSMGNVVVSSAISDWDMVVDRFLMLNAAVPLESYDASAQNVAFMQPNYWSQIEQRLWSTHWHELFPQQDGRRNLTWVDRFADVASRTTAINYYSSQEDVLNNNPVARQLPPLGAEYAWVTQEMTKGTSVLPALITFDVQGGWGVDISWMEDSITDAGVSKVLRDVNYYNNITNDEASTQPLFTHFKNRQLLDPELGSEAALNYINRGEVLGGAIPALSFPTGRNSVPIFGLGKNVDIALLRDGWARADPRWRHSDAKNIAYYFNYMLWDNWVLTGDLR